MKLVKEIDRLKKQRIKLEKKTKAKIRRLREEGEREAVRADFLEAELEATYTPKWIQSVYGDWFNNIPADKASPFYCAIAKLPKEVIDFVFKYYYFSLITPKIFGRCLSFLPLIRAKKKGMILFTEAIWKKSQTFISFIIAHEVAHACLGHVGGNDVHTEKSLKKQEKEADKLAIKWGFKMPKEYL